MKNLAAKSPDESTILIPCTPKQFVLQCDQWFHDGLKFFFHYLLLLEWTFGWAWSSFPCSFLFALYLEWSLNTSVDKKSNAICIFANLSSTLVCSWNGIFFSLVLCSIEVHKRRGKKPNVDRQFFKQVICIFFYLTKCNLIAGSRQYQFLGKILTHFTHFHLSTPTHLNEDYYIFHLRLFIIIYLFARPFPFQSIISSPV